MPIALDVCPGASVFSNMRVRMRLCPSRLASISPVGPPPTIITSASILLPSAYFSHEKNDPLLVRLHLHFIAFMARAL